MLSGSGTGEGTSAAAAPRVQPVARRKFWGWGLEGQGLALSEIEQLGAIFAERLGMDGMRVQAPPRVAELDLPAPRLVPPASLEPPPNGIAAIPASPHQSSTDTSSSSRRGKATRSGACA